MVTSVNILDILKKKIQETIETKTSAAITESGVEALLNTIPYIGNEQTTPQRFLQKSSAATAANSLTLGGGNYFIVAGATQMNAIVDTGWTAGSEITLEFGAAPLVKHNNADTGAEFLLRDKQDFQAAAGDTLTLKYNGTNWVEIARSQVVSGNLRAVYTTVTAALLDGALSISVLPAVTGATYKLVDFKAKTGTNFAAGGNRTITLQDSSGTKIFTTITNAWIESQADLKWGDSAAPITTFGASTAGEAIVFKYAGGTTDHSGTGTFDCVTLWQKTA
jgi:hypothetical protein